MRVFACEFTGHYPVGACAVVVAEDLDTAKGMLLAELAKEGLSLRDSDKWQEIDTTAARAVMILNGDY